MRVFTTALLTLEGALLTKTSAQSVISLAYDHHFGGEVGK
jgi:hypothetical protein